MIALHAALLLAQLGLVGAEPDHVDSGDARDRIEKLIYGDAREPRTHVVEELVNMGDDGISILLPYLESEDREVRRKVYGLFMGVGKRHSEPERRREFVEWVAAGLQDTENRRDVAGLLQSFQPEDFSNRAQDFIRVEMERLDPQSQFGNYVMLLVGVAGMVDQLPRLQEVVDRYGPLDATNPRWYASPAFTALRVRARLGVEEDVHRCIDLVERHPEPDIRVASLFANYLSYVRRPEVVRYLWGYIESDKTTAFHGDDVVNIDYSWAAIYTLRAMLDPEQTPNTSDREVWLAWMEAHKDNWPLKR